MKHHKHQIEIPIIINVIRTLIFSLIILILLSGKCAMPPEERKYFIQSLYEIFKLFTKYIFSNIKI
jgi:hypothetical protein